MVNLNDLKQPYNSNVDIFNHMYYTLPMNSKNKPEKIKVSAGLTCTKWAGSSETDLFTDNAAGVIDSGIVDGKP